eukprot:UN03449
MWTKTTKIFQVFSHNTLFEIWLSPLKKTKIKWGKRF